MMMRIAVAVSLLAAVAACSDEKKPAQDPTMFTTTTSSPPVQSAPDTRTQPVMSTDTPTTLNDGAMAPPMATTGVGSDQMPSTTQPTNGAMNADTSTGKTSATPITTQKPDTSMAPAPATADTKPATKKTPMDQGNSNSEVKITASIRKTLIADKTLSTTAKNAKVITEGTKVTLRGSVKTDAEKSLVEQYARQAAGVTDVDNQLEVKK